MNITLALDNATAIELESLAPHKNMFDLNRPRTLSNAASLPKPVISTISNFIHYSIANRPVNPVKQAFLESLAVS